MNPLSATISPSEAAPAPPGPSLGLRLQRGQGAVAMIFSGATGSTRLKHLYQKDPCRVLFPDPLPGEPVTAVIATTSGGITGGDCLSIQLTAVKGAVVTATTQAAEKIYRSLGDDGTVHIRVEAEPGAWVEWMPQETILFNGGRLRRRTTVDAPPGSMLMAGELLILGRRARGEVFKSGFLHDSWRVLRSGCLQWTDTLRLDSNTIPMLEEPAGFAGAVAMATVVFVAEDVQRWLDTARDLLRRAKSRSGVTCVNGLLVVRFLSSDPQLLRADYGEFWAGFRSAVGGLPKRLPRVWDC